MAKNKVANKSVTALNEYSKDMERANKDIETVTESTEQMIDMPFFEYAKFLEGKNIGELKAFRVLLQMHLDKADLYGKRLVEDTVTVLGKEQRIQMGSVFSITAKIIDRMGYMDYLLKKNSIK